MVLPCCTGFDWVLLGFLIGSLFLRFYWVLLIFSMLPFIVTGFYRVSIGDTVLYWVLLVFFSRIWVKPCCPRFYWVLLRFSMLPFIFTGFYRVSIEDTVLYWVLLGFTGFF